jgi:hypothetical protein
VPSLRLYVDAADEGADPVSAVPEATAMRRALVAVLALDTLLLVALWFQLPPRRVYIERNPAIYEEQGAWRLTLLGNSREEVTPHSGKCLRADDVLAGRLIWTECCP